MSKLTEDLARSGLVDEDIKKLKITSLTKDATRNLVKKSQPSYKIPYFDIQGKPIDYFRVRFLAKPTGLAGKAKKYQRYSQPIGSPPRLYFPPLVNWAHIAKLTDLPIIITEGEKKAAKACKEGLPTIGLGGVWSFRSKKSKKLLIDDFDLIQWEGREVYIIYDSDLLINADVARAMVALSKQLTDKGAYVFNGYVPEVDGKKAGIDDYLLKYSTDDLMSLPMEEYGGSSALWGMNEKVAVIKELAAIYHFPTKKLFHKSAFTEVVCAEFSHEIVDGNGVLKKVQTAPIWLKWPSRRVHNNVVYEPGGDLITEGNNLNIWQGWGVEPQKGDLKPWHKLIDFIFKDDKEFKEWFLMWLAYPLQHPGTKLYTAVLLISLSHGMGKSFIGLIMGVIYGKNFYEASQEDIESTNNHWAAKRQFILADEITSSNKRRESDRRNSLLTRRELTVNIKYEPQYTIKDYLNYLYTSNHPDAAFVSDKDRRMAIHEILGDPLSDKDYRIIEEWMLGDGPSHLFHHLLHDVDVSKFNPHAKAISSASKDDMIILSKSDVDTFVSTLKEDPSHVLAYDSIRIDRDLFTNSEVMRLYDPEGLNRTSKVALGKALRRAGFIQCPITQTASGSKRLWALRNIEQWRKSGGGQRTANYDKSVVMLEQARKKKFSKG